MVNWGVGFLDEIVGISPDHFDESQLSAILDRALKSPGDPTGLKHSGVADTSAYHLRNLQWTTYYLYLFSITVHFQLIIENCFQVRR